MNNLEKERVVKLVQKTLVEAGSTFRDDKKNVYLKAIQEETNEQARWCLGTIYQNALVAEKNRSPLCDDTGIPHLVLDVGEGASLDADTLDAIREGVALGLETLPGRPMGVLGDTRTRLEQSRGLDPASSGVAPAPFHVRRVSNVGLKLHILMFGGGPAIRSKTFRIFHQHNAQRVLDEIVQWSREGVLALGCSPCTLAVGVGRSHFEASSLALEALVDGDYSQQDDLEREITEGVNQTNVGALGLGGKTTVLATFMKVGAQRSSGVRIVCVRPCCCFEPRIASVELSRGK